MVETIDLYSILGVPYDATAEDIKNAYDARMKERQKNTAIIFNTQMDIIEDAYKILSDETEKETYDILLADYKSIEDVISIGKEDAMVHGGGHGGHDSSEDTMAHGGGHGGHDSSEDTMAPEVLEDCKAAGEKYIKVGRVGYLLNSS